MGEADTAISHPHNSYKMFFSRDEYWRSWTKFVFGDKILIPQKCRSQLLSHYELNNSGNV